MLLSLLSFIFIIGLIWFGAGYVAIKIVVKYDEDPIDRDDVRTLLLLGIFSLALTVWEYILKLEFEKIVGRVLNKVQPTDKEDR